MLEITPPATTSRFLTQSGSSEARPFPFVLVAIPALDEDPTIGQVIRSIPTDISRVGGITVVVIDDGSSDQTARKAVAAGARVVRHEHNQGLGVAFRTACEIAIETQADILVTLDGDGQFDPTDIPTLIAPVLSGAADFATASRFLDPKLIPEMPRAKYWGNLLMSRVISNLAGRRLRDVSCGMRCYSRDALLRLNVIGRFTYTQETILDLSFKGLRLVEVPIKVLGSRPYGSSRIASNLFRYGYRSAAIIARCYRDYRPIQFFGGLGLLSMIGAFVLAAFLLSWYLRSGQFSPHKWAAAGAVTLSLLGCLLFHLGMLGDMLNRQRLYLEEILFRQRKGPGAGTK